MEDKVKQVIVVRTDLNMTSGKVAAQVAHGAMLFILRKLTPFIEVPQHCDHDDEPEVVDFINLSPFTEDEKIWMGGEITKVVVGVKSLDKLLELKNHADALGVTAHLMVDNGYTELEPQTITCLAIGPARSSLINPITGHLRLL